MACVRPSFSRVPALNIVFVLLAILLFSGASAAAQSPFAQTTRGTIHFPGQAEPIPGLRGFSISLVQGSLTTGTASDVPPAAAKALADLRDFLPYKSYKLLDTQWSAGSGRVTGRLRGVNGKEYELELSTRRESGRDGSLSVSRFVLREAGSDAAAGGSAFLYGGGGTSTAEGRPQEERARAEAAQDRDRTFVRLLASVRPVIDTSFSMDIGETIVVGTSRLQGDTALIVLLTAVPRAATAQGR